MTYNPLFLATKADHFYIPLHKFITSLDNGREADVKAPEFLLMQGLRFTLDVRHPMRALEGGIAEIQSLASEGQLGNLDRQVDGRKQTAVHRIGNAADKAKTLLVTAAQMTDAYFLYTPAQIWLASMLANDRQLILAYLKLVFSRIGEDGSSMREKLVSTVTACAELLSSYVSPDNDTVRAKEIRKAGRKLIACQNPEKTDLVELTRLKAAEKREGSESDAERVLKKRKMEREKLQKDGDVFGQNLKRVT
jgi:cyclin H